MYKLLRSTGVLWGLFLAVSLSAQPANDDCANATIITAAGDLAFTTIDATTDGPYHPDECVGGTTDSLYNDVWYRYTPDFTGTAEFNTCGTADFDTNIAVYPGTASCPPDSMDVISCSEDADGCDGFTSKTRFEVVAGQEYLLRIGGWGRSTSPGGESGMGTFYVGPIPPPDNDDCASATVIGEVTDEPFSTLGASTDGPYHPDACVGGTTDSLYNDIWYRYTPTFTGQARFSTCGTADFDTNIAIYPGTESCPPDSASVIACSEDGTGCDGFTSEIVFDVEAGTEYLLRIGGWGRSTTPGGESGSGTFSLGPNVVVNDECENATAISGTIIDMAFSSVGATTSAEAPAHDCAGGAHNGMFNDIWYLYTPDFTGPAEFSTCGTADFDTNIAIYAPNSACPPDSTDLLSCSEDATGCPDFTSQAIWDVVAGETYLIRIGGWGRSDSTATESGSGTFVAAPFVEPMRPENDECSDAIVLVLSESGDTTVAFTTLDATTSDPIHSGTDAPGCLEDDEPVPYNDVWYSYTATFDGFLQFSNCGTASFDSKIAAYVAGENCPPAEEDLVACGDDGCPGFTSEVNFPVTTGTTYLLRVGAWSESGTGTGTITIGRIPPPIVPPNDSCQNSESFFVITPQAADDFDEGWSGFTNNGTGASDPAPSCMSGNEFTDVWYNFNSGTNTELELRFSALTDGAEFVVELYDACGMPVDTMNGPDFCLNTADSTFDFFQEIITGFPGTPTEYLMRVSSDLTFFAGGEFFFQMVGNPVSSVEEIPLDNFKFFPNPTSEELNLQFNLRTAGEGAVEIHDAFGRTLSRHDLGRLGTGVQRHRINLNDLSPGVYMARLLVDEGQRTVKFIKQ